MKIEFEKLERLLNENHQWPSVFRFKFVVPLEKRGELTALLPRWEQLEERPSSGGKYIGLTFHCPMGSAKEVLEVYSRVKSVTGIIAL